MINPDIEHSNLGATGRCTQPCGTEVGNAKNLFIDTNCVPTKLSQLQKNLKTVELMLSVEHIKRLDAISDFELLHLATL